MFCKKAVLKSLEKFTRRHICKSLFLNNMADLLPINLFYKSLLYRRFRVNFAIFSRHLFRRAPLGYCFYCISFCSLRRPQPLNGTLDLFFCLFPLNIFRANNVDHLHVAISGVPRQLVVTELIYCWYRKRSVKTVAGNQKQLPSSK